MANILQFIIDIQSRQNGVVQQVQRVQNKIDDTDRSVQKLNGRLTGLKSALMSLPGAEFFTNPIVAMTAATGIIAKMGMDADKTAVSFNVLTGSMEKGSKLLGQINKYADDTIYDRLGTQEAAKTMLGFGVSLEDVMGDLKMLGDVAMGDKQRLSQLALVFGQVAAAGKLQGQDLLQLINAGYNPLLDMSALTGKSVSDLRDEMSKGNITFEMLRQAFQRATGEGGKFYNMTNAIAETPYGRWQQLVGEFNSKLLEMYQIIQPALIPAMNGLSAILSMTTPVIKAVADGIGWVRDNLDWLSVILIPIGTAWAAYNGYMFVSTTILKGWTIAQWAQVTALIAAEKAMKLLNLAMWKNPVFWITGGIMLLGTAIYTCWKKFAGFRATIKGAWDAIWDLGVLIKDFIVSRIQGLLSGIGRIGSAIAKLFKGEFKAAWDEAKKGAKEIIGADDFTKMARGAVGVVSDAAAGRYYQKRLDAEYRKERKGKPIRQMPSPYDPNKPQWEAWAPKWEGGIANMISDPKAASGTNDGTDSNSSTPPTDSSGKGSEQAVTGGTRNTQITMNIGKFFDYLNVTMMDKADSREIQRIVLESINRSLEIATSAAR